MTERELKKLGRTDLLEMLLEQSKENEKLRNELEAANEKLADRTLKIDNAGSLAEAALQLNGVFEAAQAACLQYSENIKLLSFRQEQICGKLEAETNEKCEQLERETNEKCSRLEMETKIKCEQLERETNEKCASQERETNERCLEQECKTNEKCSRQEMEMTAKCEKMLREAKQQSEAYWTEVSGKIQEFTKSYADLQKLWEKSPFVGK